MAKNLANCTFGEFMKQTSLIKHSVASWINDTDIMNIRKNMPDIPDGATDEQRKELIKEQGMKNASAIFDAIFDEHPDETIKIVAALCFVPIDEVENYPMTYYMESITEMLNNNTVWDFFISLAVAARKLGITPG